MGQRTDPLIRQLRARYLPRLQRRYDPTLVLAFGSRARGEALEQSDLDLVVVSERFRGVPFLERSTGLLTDLAPPFPVDVLCYTREEFARKRREFGIVRTAVEEGVRVDEPLSPEGRSKAKRRPKRSAGGAKAFDEAVRQKRRRGDGAR